MPNVQMIRNGKGRCMINGERPFADFYGCDFNMEIQSEEFESGEDNTFVELPKGMKYTLSLTLKDGLTATIVSMFTGSSITTNQLLDVTDESQTVPSAPGPYTVDLDNADNIAGSEIVRSAVDGKRYERAAAAAADKYSISGDTLTFHEDNADDTLLIDYFRTSATAGRSVSIDPNASPSEVEIYLLFQEYDMDAGALSTQFKGLKLGNCMPKGTLNAGLQVNQLGELAIEFAVQNSTDGDIVFYDADRTYYATS